MHAGLVEGQIKGVKNSRIHLIEVSIKREPTVKIQVFFLLLVSLGMERMERKDGKRPTQSEFLYIVLLCTNEAILLIL